MVLKEGVLRETHNLLFLSKTIFPLAYIMPPFLSFVDTILTGSRYQEFGASARYCNTRNIPPTPCGIPDRRRPGTGIYARTLCCARASRTTLNLNFDLCFLLLI